MADLRCEEILEPPSPSEAMEIHGLTPLGEPQPEVHGQQNFCTTTKDRALLEDSRVFTNMLRLENYYMPNMDHYDSLQDEIKIHMRKIVAEWMLDVCVDQRCHVDVFLLATNVMDRFLATIKLAKNQFQLLGAASLFLASKMIEPSPIPALTLIKCTADTYDREELLSMELLILSKLQWDLSAITPYDYLDVMINSLETEEVLAPKFKSRSTAETSESVRRDTEKLVTLCATDDIFVPLKPSVLAAASLLTAIERSDLAKLVNLNEIIDSVENMANLDKHLVRSCKAQIGQIFLDSTNQTEADEVKRRATPTEVFSVSAYDIA